MKLTVPALKAVSIPQWEFRYFHNETDRDLEIAITHDDLKNDHIVIRDPTIAEPKSEKIEAMDGEVIK